MAAVNIGGEVWEGRPSELESSGEQARTPSPPVPSPRRATGSPSKAVWRFLNHPSSHAQAVILQMSHPVTPVLLRQTRDATDPPTPVSPGEG